MLLEETLTTLSDNQDHTSLEKEGMKGSSRQVRRYTRPTEVLITIAQLTGSSL